MPLKLKTAVRICVIGCLLLISRLVAAAGPAQLVTLLSPNKTDSLRVGTTHRIHWRCQGSCDQMRISLLRRTCHQRCTNVWVNGRLVKANCGADRCRLTRGAEFVVRPTRRGNAYFWNWRIPPDHPKGLFHFVVQSASKPSARNRLMKLGEASDSVLISDKRITIDQPKAGERIRRGSKPYSIRFRIEGVVTAKLKASVDCGASGGEHVIVKGVGPERGVAIWRRPGFAGDRRLGPLCNRIRIIVETEDGGLFRVSDTLWLVR